MKFIVLVFLLLQGSVFAQLDKSRAETLKFLKITSKNQSIKKDSSKVTKVFSNTKDTLNVQFDDKNIAVDFIFSNASKGFSAKQFHTYSKQFNESFQFTDVFSSIEFDYFYDSKSHRLIVKKYASKLKEKVVLIRFLSDFETIKTIVPQVKNL